MFGCISFYDRAREEVCEGNKALPLCAEGSVKYVYSRASLKIRIPCESAPPSGFRTENLLLGGGDPRTPIKNSNNRDYYSNDKSKTPSRFRFCLLAEWKLSLHRITPIQKSSSGGSQSPRSGVVIGGKLPDGVTVSVSCADNGFPHLLQSSARVSFCGQSTAHPANVEWSPSLNHGCRDFSQKTPIRPKRCVGHAGLPKKGVNNTNDFLSVCSIKAFFAYSTPRVCDFYVSFYCFFASTLDFSGGRDRHVRLDSRPPVHVDGSRILRSPSPGVVIAADNARFYPIPLSKSYSTDFHREADFLIGFEHGANNGESSHQRDERRTGSQSHTIRIELVQI
ncbi:hypothetical protein CDAR_274151 [Caerostris darwini]|uniref:Uncharacterized protein n=1 Tax=Caerostris darwini TaxID=1538125 RepID=A0AAV4RCN1_9ARAC|nr:hypothetical protein CDAR_274151 [Caerostris darwini]